MLRLALIVVSLFALCLPVLAQPRTVAITVDDLPYVYRTHTSLTPADVARAREVNGKLLRAFKKHQVPVTGLVNQERSDALGSNAGNEILRQWVVKGFDLGNHTYSHPDINELSVPQIEDEIVRDEPTIAELMKAAGKRLEFFRFPMNHTGDTKAKHDAIAAFLAHHGYKIAVCTIDNSDYLFNDAYASILAKKDNRTARRLRREYIAYTSSEIDYYAALNKQVLGYEPPQVMLLHDNQLNADTIASLLKVFERKNYKFVSLRTAESDKAYSIPDTLIIPYGWMWGYRWAKELNVKVNGRLEPGVAEWVLNYKPNR